MGIASLILGILALLGSWIPIIGIFLVPEAVIGIILGVVSVVNSKKNKDKGQRGVSIAGLVVSVVALLSIVGFTILWASAGNDYVFDLEEVIEDNGVQPGDVAALSGHLGFHTLSYSCQVDPEASTCSLDFSVVNSGPEAVEVNSIDQTLVYAWLTPIEDYLKQQPKYSFTAIEAISGSCVDLVLGPSETQTCQAVFEVLPAYSPQFARYTQSPESALSNLVVLPGPDVPSL